MRFLKALLLVLVCLPAFGQQIDPATRIRWGTYKIPVVNIVSGAYLGSQCLMTSPDTFSIVAGDCGSGDGSGGGGTVTNVSNLYPLFTTTNSSTVPTFLLSDAAANTVFGNCATSSAAPSYCSLTTAMMPDLSPIYAALSGGKINSSVIPDLSATYAALSGGKVPTSLLGTGTANNTKCLLGDQTWGACSTGGNVATGTIQGQVAAWDTATSTYKPQTKSVIDVRDISGVYCDYSNDSSAALNNLTNNGQAAQNGAAIVFPPNCHIKLTSTWLIKNLSGFTIRGVSGAGANGYYGTNVPTISWCGADAGTVIDMEYVDGFLVENLAIDGSGSGCANSALVGINVDKTGTGGSVNTTDGLFRRLLVNASLAGATAQTNWKGISFAAVSGNNVEDMRVSDSTFNCKSRTGSTGVWIGPSANAKKEVLDHNNFNSCNYGIYAQNGQTKIVDNEFSGNLTASIRLDQWTDPIFIAGNVEEGDAQFLVVGTGNAAPITISQNNIAPGGAANLTVYQVDVAGANKVNFLGNSFDSNSNLTKVLGSSTGNTVTSYNIQGNTWPNTSFTAPWVAASQGAFVINAIQGGVTANNYMSNSLTLFNNFGSGHGNNIASPQLAFQSQGDSGTNDIYSIQGIPAGINGSPTASTLVIAHSGFTNPWLGFVGTSSGFGLGAMATPAAPSLSTSGTAGSTSYTYKIVALSGSGHTPVSSGTTIATGNATLSSTNFNNIRWVSLAGAVAYDIYRTASGGTPSSTGKIGQAPAMLTSSAAGAQASNYLFTDTGLTGDSTTAPTDNTTGQITGLAFIKMTEAAAPTGAASSDLIWADSTAHRVQMNNNNGGAQNVLGANDWAVPGTIGSTTPNTGAFTTLSATTTINAGTQLQIGGVALASTNLSDTANLVRTTASATYGAFTYDFSAVAHSLPIKSGTVAAKPATCTFTAGAAMEIYVATDATAGQNLYFCTATNTWTQQLNSGGGNAPFIGGAAGTSFQDVNEIAAPANPAAGVERLYTNSTTHRFECLTSAGASCNPVATSAALNVLTAAAGANSINNGDNAQAWKWAPTSASKTMFEISENTAGTGGSGAQFLLNVDTLAASTAIPFQVTARGTSNGITVDRVTGTLSAIGSANINATQYKGGTAAGTGSCTNQVETADNDAAAPTCATITSAYTTGTFAPNAHNILSASHGDSTASSAVRGGAIFAIGASPTWTQVAHSLVAGGYWYWNGTDVIASTGAAAGTGACTNQVVTAENSDAAPTCTTLSSGYVNTSIAVTGVDINTSSQVTATHLSGALPGGQGGTGNAFMQFAGPGTSLKTYTLPNASDTIATLGAAAQTFTNGLVAPSFTGSTAPLTPNAAGGTELGSTALPWAGVFIGAAATNNIHLTGTATSAKTATLPDNTGTVAELNLAQTWSATQTFGAIIPTGITGLTSVITPNAAGGTTVGSNALPFSSVYIGGSATNNIQLTGTGTTAKVATLPDNTGTVAELNFAQTWTAAQAHSSPINPSSAGGTTNGTNALPWSSVYVGNAATNNIQVTGTATSAKTATFPDNTGTIAETNLRQNWSAAQFQDGNLLRVTADFTSASSTALQTITGLSFTLPANLVSRVPFTCEMTYHQNTATAAVAFGIQSATISPTNISARGWQMTSASVQNVGILATLASTTATNIVSSTPSAITTNWAVRLSGLIDNPSNASTNTINIMVSQATAADTVTVLKDSWCKIF